MPRKSKPLILLAVYPIESLSIIDLTDKIFFADPRVTHWIQGASVIESLRSSCGRRGSVEGF